MAQLNRAPVQQKDEVVKNKGGRPTNRSRAGRPTVITEEVLRKLQEAFLMDCTDEEACCYADIGTTAFYEYQKANPEFAEKKQVWKQNPFVVARKTIMRGLEKDHVHALKYMKNKKNKEFNERQETDVTSGGEKIQTFQVSQLTGQELDDAIAQHLSKTGRRK